MKIGYKKALSADGSTLWHFVYAMLRLGKGTKDCARNPIPFHLEFPLHFLRKQRLFFRFYCSCYPIWQSVHHKTKHMHTGLNFPFMMMHFNLREERETLSLERNGWR